MLYKATGDCFGTAWKTFYEAPSSSKRLCHGVVTGRGALQGVKFAHAWVEDVDKDEVIDKTMPLFANGFPRDGYYGLAGLDDNSIIFKYDLHDVAEKAQQYMTTGPWEDVLWDYIPR